MKQVKKAHFIIGGWLLAVLSLFFYSFTQIDLGLTLTRISFWQILQKKFQLIGYFHRPLSACLYFLILVLLFSFYLLILKGVQKKWLSEKQIWWLIILTVVLLWLSYNAFSYDLFNYIFDAKILIYYQQNPYQVKPLDFPQDPMLGFMHWTHRPTAYPPFWIGLSVLPYLLGLGRLVPLILAFKGLMAGAYLGTLWLIWKMGSSPKLFRLVFYALNPLVLIESLVSAHNDGVMIFFAFLGFYWLWQQRPWRALFPWLFSIGIKLATLALLPLFGYGFWQRLSKKKINPEKLTQGAIWLMLAAVIFVGWRLGHQPWYWLWLLPFLALKKTFRFSFWLMTGLTLGSLLRYLPFLYYGHWNPPVPEINFWFLVLGLVLGLLLIFLEKVKFLANHGFRFD
jgi:hypothetical protein